MTAAIQDLLARGRGRLRGGDGAGALALFEDVLRAEPAHRGARLERAAALRRLGRTAEAEAAYAALLAASPDLPAALMGLGHCALDGGDRAAALARFGAAAAAEPANPWPHVEAGHLLRELGRREEAEAAYGAALGAKPGLTPALIGLGHCARLRGDREAALSRFAAAAAGDPANPWPRVEAAHLLRDLGRTEEAEAAYAAALEAKPGLVPALLGLGHCARRRGDRAAARGHFAAAARSDPGNPAAQLELAAECRDAGAPDAARAAALAVIAREPGHLNAWMSLGLTERRADRREAAREAFRAAATHHPDELRPLLELAAEELALGEAKAAEATLRRAAGMHPAAAAPVQALAEQARIAGRLGEALALARRAIALDPASLPARLCAAQILFDLGLPREAEAALDAAVAALGPRPQIAARRVQMLRRAGDLPGALALARAAQAADSGDFALWHARCQVEALLGGDEAVEDCLRAAPAATAAPEAAAVAALRAEAAELRGDRGAAERHMRESLRLNPAQPQPHRTLARLALRRFDTEAARAHLVEALRLDAGQASLQARRRKVSQSLMGQILEEILLDRALLDRLAALQALPAAERCGPICGLLRENPEATAPALALLAALREAGPLRAPPPAPGGERVPQAGAIPAAIAQFWHEPEPPPDLRALMEGWRAAHPGHAVVRFDDAGARDFLRRHAAPEVRQAFARAEEPATRADLLRLAWLDARGGFWVDADDRCLAPLGAVVPGWARLFGHQEEFGGLGNNLLGAVPGHPVVRRALRLAAEAVNRGDCDSPWLATGPGLLTRALGEEIAAACAAPRLPPGTAILDAAEMVRAAAMHVATGYKAAGRNRADALRRGRGPARAALPMAVHG